MSTERTGVFRFVEGATSDLTLVASGRTLEDVFAAAAEALLAATVERPDRVEARVARTLSLRDRSADLLLLRFLNELIWLRDAEDVLLRARTLVVRVDGEASLECELEGEPLDLARHEPANEVKAATLHALDLSRTSEGWTAKVTLDI